MWNCKLVTGIVCLAVLFLSASAIDLTRMTSSTAVSDNGNTVCCLAAQKLYEVRVGRLSKKILKRYDVEETKQKLKELGNEMTKTCLTNPEAKDILGKQVSKGELKKTAAVCEIFGEHAESKSEAGYRMYQCREEVFKLGQKMVQCNTEEEKEEVEEPVDKSTTKPAFKKKGAHEKRVAHELDEVINVQVTLLSLSVSSKDEFTCTSAVAGVPMKQTLSSPYLFFGDHLAYHNHAEQGLKGEHGKNSAPCEYKSGSNLCVWEGGYRMVFRHINNDQFSLSLRNADFLVDNKNQALEIIRFLAKENNGKTLEREINPNSNVKCEKAPKLTIRFRVDLV